MGQTVLEMTGIKKSFAGIYALNGIDFSLELGEVHALLGENGAGKSTLIKVLGGIYQPDCGLIKVNGKEVKIDGVPAARANGIGIIHQEIVLVPYLTVAQNLFLGREIRTRLGTLDEAEMNRRAADMISALGVNIKAETVVEKLTIAQQQMVEITLTDKGDTVDVTLKTLNAGDKVSIAGKNYTIGATAADAQKIVDAQKVDGKTVTVKSPQCICCQILTTRFSRVKGRFQIILVDENLGF